MNKYELIQLSFYQEINNTGSYGKPAHTVLWPTPSATWNLNKSSFCFNEHQLHAAL